MNELEKKEIANSYLQLLVGDEKSYNIAQQSIKNLWKDISAYLPFKTIRDLKKFKPSFMWVDKPFLFIDPCKNGFKSKQWPYNISISDVYSPFNGSIAVNRFVIHDKDKDTVIPKLCEYLDKLIGNKTSCKLLHVTITNYMNASPLNTWDIAMGWINEMASLKERLNIEELQVEIDTPTPCEDLLRRDVEDMAKHYADSGRKDYKIHRMQEDILRLNEKKIYPHLWCITQHSSNKIYLKSKFIDLLDDLVKRHLVFDYLESQIKFDV